MTQNKKKVIVLRGLPASGKSTWAKRTIANEYYGRAIRINNDDLSKMLFGGADSFGMQGDVAGMLHSLRLRMLETALQQDWIELVIIDNTNLATKTVKSLWNVAQKFGAEFEVDDQFLAVDVRECVARDKDRLFPVGEDVIVKMARQAEQLKPWVAPARYAPIEPYHNSETLNHCIIVDIDGTLAHMDGRDPYDYSRVHTDIPDLMVSKVVKQLSRMYKVVIMSGRDDNCMDVTVEWLRSNDIPFDEIHMRTTGDVRPDWVVKNELFQQHIADQYHVALVIDDRDQVIDLWRNKLGLKTWQVANGDF